ncbi:hypothetical protein BJV82DRAFT_611432 [Fennellomyces sp. T-0311]|nr:hypothetical protein BJV82DRAFT_611432 [Fennellomyces sp. T-0311]
MASSPSIIWSPHPDSNKFLVGGTELKLYEWIPATSDTPGSAHFLLSNIPKIVVMCADWSPDPYQRDLIAIGLITGKTLLVRMQSDIMDSPYPSSTDGINSPTPLYRNPSRSSTKQPPTLGVKMSRPCNVVSFSQTHPHLLACGLDKVRNDPCLLVWDVSQAIDGDTPTGTTPSTPHLTDRKFNSLGMDSSVPYPSSAYREQRPILQYGSSEAITSCTWSAHAGSPLLIAGMGYKYLRVYDIRADANAAPLQFSTKAVYGTSIDPFNPYRMASYNEEGVIKLWDLRKTNDSVLTLNSESSTKHALSKIAFSPTRPGLLASVSKDTPIVNLWDIQETSILQNAVPPTSYGSETSSGLRAITGFASSEPTDNTPHIPGSSSVPVLWRSRESAPSSKPITTFGFIPRMADDGSVPSLLTMHRDGQFESIDLEEASKMTWQPTGGIMATNGTELLSCGGYPAVRRFPELSRLHISDVRSQTDTYEMEECVPAEIRGNVIDSLGNDISVVMRKRVKMGYSMEYQKNLSITRDDHKLHELWAWLQKADELTKSGRADYTNQGVYFIWKGLAKGSTSPQSRKSSMSTKGVMRETPPDYGSPKKTLERLSAKEIPEDDDDMLGMVSTTKRIQRDLALKMCGFDYTKSELEQELIRLESIGEYDQAAGWAFFCGLTDRAIQALGSVRGTGEDDQQRKLMSAVLAGFQPGSADVNPTWRQLCESLSQDMIDRPYLRAIFAFISSNDWYRVLNEPRLSLKERVAVALRVLEDEQLTVYLEKSTERVIEEGDVEGVLLTGLSQRAVDLFEQTVNRYGDVQTASLVMSYVAPQKIKDKRVEDWVESYRGLLDRWQLWHQRAKFDIERGKRMNNASEIATPQVYVRCTYCSQTLGHSLQAQNVRNRDGKRMNVQTNISAGRASGKQKVTDMSSYTVK